MEEPDVIGENRFQFTLAEVAEMGRILNMHNNAMPTQEVHEALADKFSFERKEYGQGEVPVKLVVEWFQGKLYALNAKDCEKESSMPSSWTFRPEAHNDMDHGPGMLVDLPNPPEEDMRILIVPAKNNSFAPSNVVRQIAARCIRKDFRPGWTCLQDVEPESFDQWFDRFRQIAKWAPEHDIDIRRNFRRKCGVIISNSFCNYRRGRSKKCPAFCTPEVLQKNQEKWESDPSFKTMSKRNKRNCRGLKHKSSPRKYKGGGGPHPIHLHEEQPDNELGRRQNVPETSNRLKRKSDMSCIDSQGKLTADRYGEKHKTLEAISESVLEQEEFIINPATAPETLDLRLANLFRNFTELITNDLVAKIGDIIQEQIDLALKRHDPKNSVGSPTKGNE